MIPRLSILITAIASLALLPACRRTSVDATRIFDVTGVVRAPLHDGQVVIEHEAIPDFMPAMTMPFYIAGNATADASRLNTGDRVRFRFVVGSSSHAEQFKVFGRDAAPPGIETPLTSKRPPRLHEGGLVPEFALVDQDNRPLTRADLQGQLTLVTFIFTRCPVPEFCPAMTQRFAFLQGEILADEKLRASTRMLSVTLDPEFDRPEILRAYGEAMGANFATWRFATGAPNDAKALARAFAVFSERKGATLDHTLCTALIGTDGRVLELWRGNGWTTAEVLASLRTTAR